MAEAVVEGLLEGAGLTGSGFLAAEVVDGLATVAADFSVVAGLVTVGYLSVAVGLVAVGYFSGAAAGFVYAVVGFAGVADTGFATFSY